MYSILKILRLQSEQSSSWYQWIDFGKQQSWQYFKMSIWTSDSVSEKQLIDKQTFLVSPGYHKSLRYCGNQNCSIRIYFAYSLINNGNQCQYNQTSILCPSERTNGTLKIYIRLGDKWLSRTSYISVIAYNLNGDLKSLKTVHSGDKLNNKNGTKEWNQLFDFGLDTWIQFHVEVYYEHSSGLRRCTNTTTYNLHSHDSQTFVKQECDEGYIYFDYHFLPLDHSSAQDYSSHHYFAQAWTLFFSLTINW